MDFRSSASSIWKGIRSVRPIRTVEPSSAERTVMASVRARGGWAPRRNFRCLVSIQPESARRGPSWLLALPAGGDEACSRISRENSSSRGRSDRRVLRTDHGDAGRPEVRGNLAFGGRQRAGAPAQWYSTAESEEDSSWPIRRNLHRCPERIGLASAAILLFQSETGFLAHAGPHPGKSRSPGTSSKSCAGHRRIRRSPGAWGKGRVRAGRRPSGSASRRRLQFQVEAEGRGAGVHRQPPQKSPVGMDRHRGSIDGEAGFGVGDRAQENSPRWPRSSPSWGKSR